jgi:hypothetical protein
MFFKDYINQIFILTVFIRALLFPSTPFTSSRNYSQRAVEIIQNIVEMEITLVEHRTRLVLFMFNLVTWRGSKMDEKCSLKNVFNIKKHCIL